MSNSECRKKAKALLKGCYAESFFVVMVCVVVYLIFKISDIVKIAVMLYNSSINTGSLFQTTDILSGVLKYLSGTLLFAVMTPLVTGGLWWFYQTASGGDNKSILKLYTGFRLNIRAAALYLLIWLITMMSLLPTGICWGVAGYFFEKAESFYNQTVVLFVALQFFMVGIFLTGLYLKAVCSFLLSPFIFLKNPDMNVFKILNRSRKKIYGHKLSALRLIMTYVPVMLLIVTIPFVLPKAIMSVSVFACDRIGEEAWEN